jgi:hypothetical protein
MIQRIPGQPDETPQDHSTVNVPGTLSLLWFWRGAVLRVVGTMVLTGLAFYVTLVLIEIPVAPWIRSFGLWPTLTGGWHGVVQTADGRTSYVYLEIRGEVFSPGSRRARDSYIQGFARWCDDTGRIRNHDIWGNPDNWRGTKFHLSTRSEVDREAGVSLGDLQGEWNGDEIRATGVLVSHARTATAYATRTSRSPSAPPLVRYTLRRGSENEFLAACGTKG